MLDLGLTNVLYLCDVHVQVMLEGRTMGGKVSVITCIFYLFIYFILLIDVFFYVDSKTTTIGFWRSHVVFEL